MGVLLSLSILKDVPYSKMSDLARGAAVTLAGSFPRPDKLENSNNLIVVTTIEEPPTRVSLKLAKNANDTMYVTWLLKASEQIGLFLQLQ